MHWKGETTTVSSWQSRPWKSWRRLWTAPTDSCCQSIISSLASAQAKAQQMQSLLSGSFKRSIYLPTRDYIDLEKAFDLVSQKVIWVLKKLGVEEWIVRLVQGMYANVHSCVCVGDGYNEEFEVKVHVHQGSVLSLCSSSLCLKPCNTSSTLGFPGRTSMPMTLLSSLMSQEALDLERNNGGERTESKCRKDKDHDLWYGPGPPAEFRPVSMPRWLHCSGQQEHLLQWLQVLGAQQMQWAQTLDKGS